MPFEDKDWDNIPDDEKVSVKIVGIDDEDNELEDDDEDDFDDDEDEEDEDDIENEIIQDDITDRGWRVY